MAATTWTAKAIKARILTPTENPAKDLEWIERSILAIYARQTSAEQHQRETRLDNGVGFSAFDAQLGSYLAEYLRSGRHLSGQWVAKGRSLAARYAQQLAEAAEARAAGRVLA